MSSLLSPTLGKNILTVQDIPDDQIHVMKLKGVAICFNILKASLCGNYVNFGAFKLYGDRALEDALQTFIEMLISTPLESLLVGRC